MPRVFSDDLAIHLPVVKRFVGSAYSIPQRKYISNRSTLNNLPFHQARHIIDLPADSKRVDHLLQAFRQVSSCSVTMDVRSKISIPWGVMCDAKGGPS